MAQIPLIYTDEQRLTWIAFCAAQNLLIYRSNPRPSSLAFSTCNSSRWQHVIRFPHCTIGASRDVSTR